MCAKAVILVNFQVILILPFRAVIVRRDSSQGYHPVHRALCQSPVTMFQNQVVIMNYRVQLVVCHSMRGSLRADCVHRVVNVLVLALQVNCVSLVFFSSAEGAASCKACAPGRFNDVEGALSCKNCKVGYYQSRSAGLNCSICTSEVVSSGIALTCLASSECDGCVDNRDSNNAKSNSDHILSVPVIVGIVCAIVGLLIGVFALVYWKCVKLRVVGSTFSSVIPEDSEVDDLSLEEGNRSPELSTREDLVPDVIHTMFVAHDYDSDGHIDLSELQNMVKRIFERSRRHDENLDNVPSNFVAEVLMKNLDTDNNNTLEENEFTILALRVLKWTDVDMESRLSRMFHDADGDTLVHMTSFFKAMKSWISFQLPDGQES